MAIFNGQLGDTPTFHGVQPYQFDDDSWNRMSYYPSRCLGEAALKGQFENQVYSPDSEKVIENPPAAKKAKLTPEEIENKRIGWYFFLYRKSNKLLERKLKRIAKYQQSIDLLKKGADGLILSVKQHPLPWILMLIKFMKSGRPFSVFCERQAGVINHHGISLTRFITSLKLCQLYGNRVTV